MQKKNVIVISKNVRYSACMRFVLDRLSKESKIILSANVENTDLFNRIRSDLISIYGCIAGKVETGHFKRGGSHIPIIRCEIDANSLEFSREFKPI